ncbi:hypothetical protein Q5P01_000738 [Channa striata]|uniref:Uncharacterized protein n=1 Tax=Channa striata TaxID=64152 RepID=A0AA88LMY5_CHASR|nr:hypothetical protein Q5P01_000738 [Channa striata]
MVERGASLPQGDGALSRLHCAESDQPGDERSKYWEVRAHGRRSLLSVWRTRPHGAREPESRVGEQVRVQVQGCVRAEVERTGESSFTTVDRHGRALRIERSADPRPPLKLTDGSLSSFRETVSVFSDVAFRIRGDEAVPALVLSRLSDEWGACFSPSCTPTCARFDVVRRDIRGADVSSTRVYTGDGLSLYECVSSWKTDTCLVFDQGCRGEIPRTLCALAMGDGKLGVDFTMRAARRRRRLGSERSGPVGPGPAVEEAGPTHLPGPV